ncbi:MAG TPA: glucosamine-6-phosphate deaminase [Bacillales bacterium]|nr:glucosamine-6-phosphate deaminase [Bacillales bacterium]
MKCLPVQDEKEMSKAAAEIIIGLVKEQPELHLGLATGCTPQGTYAELVRDHKKNGTSYRHATTLNLDEYVGLPRENRHSFYQFMDVHLFRHLDLCSENVHIPNGCAEDLDVECRRYDSLIAKTGGADLQLLGIGRNGHIGFNEPGTSFASETHVVRLTDSTRKANARFFPRLDDVPHQAITMGIRSIFRSKTILLLASGEQKAPAIARLFNGGIDESFPASVLKSHPDATIIADRDACRLL